MKATQESSAANQPLVKLDPANPNVFWKPKPDLQLHAGAGKL